MNWCLCFTDSPRSRSYQTNRRTNSSHASVVPAESMSAPSGGKSNSFREFLWQHIELALTKGFDDNVGRNPLPAVFEVGSNSYTDQLMLRCAGHGIRWIGSPEYKLI